MNFARRYASFTAFALITAIVTAALATVMHPARALLAGFDCGAIIFLALILRKFAADTAATMRIRAADNEPDHATLVIIALVIVAVVMTAVWTELSGSGGRHATGVALAAGTLSLTWLFTNTLFALHYAHVWYLPGKKGDAGGLDFPGDDSTPDYWDFAYFAFVLGMTFQVSDVSITTRRLRRIALFHSMLAFLFNIVVVALSVSLVAAALGG